MMPPASFVRPLPFLIALSLILTATAAAQTGLPHFAGIVDVPPGGDLQAALNAAQPGDTIRLAAGGTYTGPFDLPAKPGTGVVTIRTNTADTAFPPPGTRVNVSQASLLARVVAMNSYVFAANPGAHGYRFLGLELSPAPSTFLYNVVVLGDGTETLDQQPRDIAFERCYIHGDPVAGSRRGIAMNGRNISVVDSWVSGFKEVGADSQALAGWAGAGPFTIVNN